MTSFCGYLVNELGFTQLCEGSASAQQNILELAFRAKLSHVKILMHGVCLGVGLDVQLNPLGAIQTAIADIAVYGAHTRIQKIQPRSSYHILSVISTDRIFTVTPLKHGKLEPMVRILDRDGPRERLAHLWVHIAQLRQSIFKYYRPWF